MKNTKTFRTLLLTAVILSSTPVWGQYSLLWQNSQNVSKSIQAVAADNQGNLYVSGSFSGSLNVGGTTLHSASTSTSSFIGKLDESGIWLWAIATATPTPKKGQAAGSSLIIQDLTTDASGNAYITGRFTGSVLLGGTTLAAGTAGSDLFLAKINSSGSFAWAKKEGGSGWDAGTGIGVDANGNVYVCGRYARQAGNGNNVYTISDCYAARYTNQGTKQWEKKLTVNNVNGNGFYGNDLSLDGNGSLYIASTFKGIGAPAATISIAASVETACLLKLSSATGAVSWAALPTASNVTRGASVIADNSGNVYLAGTYATNSISFGGLSLPAPTTYSATSQGSVFSSDENCFLVKYSTGGAVNWAIQAVAMGMSTEAIHAFRYPGGGIGVYTEAGDGLYLRSFDEATGALTSSETSTGFSWQTYFDNISFAAPGSVAATPDGYVFTLNSSGSVSFGNLSLSSALPYDPNGKSDMYLVKYTLPQQRPTNVSTGTGLTEVLAYPIPVAGTLNLAVNDGTSLGSIRLVDATGRLVFSGHFSVSKEQVDMSRLPSGRYILTLPEHQKIIAIVKQ